MSIVRVAFTGAIGQDAEVKHVNDKILVTCSVPGRRGWGDNEITDWYRIEVWGKRAESMAKLIEKGGLRKGAIVTGWGVLKPRVYEGKNGTAISLDVDAREFDPVFTGQRQRGNDDDQVSF